MSDPGPRALLADALERGSSGIHDCQGDRLGANPRNVLEATSESRATSPRGCHVHHVGQARCAGIHSRTVTPIASTARRPRAPALPHCPAARTQTGRTQRAAPVRSESNVPSSGLHVRFHASGGAARSRASPLRQLHETRRCPVWGSAFPAATRARFFLGRQPVSGVATQGGGSPPGSVRRFRLKSDASLPWAPKG